MSIENETMIVYVVYENSNLVAVFNNQNKAWKYMIKKEQEHRADDPNYSNPSLTNSPSYHIEVCKVK